MREGLKIARENDYLCLNYWWQPRIMSDLLAHALEAWHQEIARADWASPSAVKLQFRTAGVLQGNRVIFNIASNHYRIVVKINYLIKSSTYASLERIKNTTLLMSPQYNNRII